MSYGRVITSVVNKEGKGVFEPDRVVPVTGLRYASEHELVNIANAEGATFLMCEMPPGTKSPMHATPSIDFGVMVSGEVVFILDSGEERTLRSGDVYVQKAASHAWENRSSEVARFTVTLLASRV